MNSGRRPIGSCASNATRFHAEIHRPIAIERSNVARECERWGNTKKLRRSPTSRLRDEGIHSRAWVTE
ncbi:hypothetical protein OPV22_009114 [Ensete ventricosum]|uniref:Uncharacterized protein n=1 Tax=Ensete ventricosum TaxID=4639 RepID=A0AAV8RCL7_ENSVE|nr:hypothetical protein OPV22_009114 [Ensete ventricosum]